MFRNEFTAKVGFTRVLDRTCSQCGGLYSSNEKSHCPKCNTALIVPSRNTDSGPRPYCFTEVTLYPKMRQETKDKHAKRTAAAKGLLYSIRMTLWGKHDQEHNTVQPDARTQYLVPKRVIRVLFNHPPTIIPYTAKDGTTKLELKYTFDSREGDQIEFLDDKQVADNAMANAAPTPAPIKAANSAVLPNNAVAALQKQLSDFTAAVIKILPAPNPADSAMSMNGPEDYQPSGNVVAQEEVSTDPFAS